MRATFLTFFGIALLGLHQPAHARKGSGDSSGEPSGGSDLVDWLFDGDDWDSCYNLTRGPIGNASDPFDPMYMDQWLYKFVGSYYNGSVEVEAAIDTDDVSCEEQRPIFKQKLDAVLMIGEQLTSLKKTNSSPYIFSIVGWKEGTHPSGMPSIVTKWVSPDARLIYESISNARSPLNSNSATWVVTNQKSGNGYSFDAIFTKDIVNLDSSLIVFSINPCNGSQPVDFHMEPYDVYSMSETREQFAQKRTRANGTFDNTSATLSIGGQFKGEFMNWYTGYGSGGKSKQGVYKLKFFGNLDRPHSHALSTSGQTPSWTKNRDLLPSVSNAAAASTSCVGEDSTESRAEVGKAILGLTTLAGLVVIGMGIVLW